jgi:hypothetical protein
MKLKAPPGVGEPCVAGAAIAARDGIYEVEAEIGALLIEAFGFVAVDKTDRSDAALSQTAIRRSGMPPSATQRRRVPAKKPTA